jgi:hypothetical protein
MAYICSVKPLLIFYSEGKRFVYGAIYGVYYNKDEDTLTYVCDTSDKMSIIFTVCCSIFFFIPEVVSL